MNRINRWCFQCNFDLCLKKNEMAMRWHMNLQLSYNDSGLFVIPCRRIEQASKNIYLLCFHFYEWPHRYIACWYYIMKKLHITWHIYPKPRSVASQNRQKLSWRGFSHMIKHSERSSWWCGVSDIMAGRVLLVGVGKLQKKRLETTDPALTRDDRPWDQN